MRRVYRTVRPFLKGELSTLLIGLLCLFFVDGFQLLMPRIIQHGVDALSYGRATASLMLKLAGFIMLLAVGVVVTRFFWRYLIIGISRRMENECGCTITSIYYCFLRHGIRSTKSATLWRWRLTTSMQLE